MVGTRVRDRMKEPISANTTASAMGANRKPEMPGRKNIGTKAMQMQSSETKAGTTICWAPSRMACGTVLPFSRCQLMFSMVTVASSTRMPTASASPPRVMMLRVWPSADSSAMENRIASGIEITITRVERQLPRNSRIIRLVRAAAMTPSLTTPDTAARTKMDWSASGTTFSDLRQGLLQARQHRLDVIHDVEGGGRAALQHRHQHGATAIHAHHIALGRRAVAHMGDVAHVDGGAVHLLDRQVVQLVDHAGAVVELHIIFELPDLDGAGRDDLVLRRQRVAPDPGPTDRRPAAPGDRDRSGSGAPCRHRAREWRRPAPRPAPGG